MVCGASQIKPQQLNTLQSLVTKHIADPSLADFASSEDFAVTTTERGLNHWEQAHLVAALDVLNAYQSSRRARAVFQVVGHFPSKRGQFTNDPRTRAVELLKRWLRAKAGDAAVQEDEVRGFCGFCRDLLNHPQLFPARNPRSFLRTVAEVYEHLQWQLREVLEHDRTCAELTHRVLSLSRNFVSDAVSFLLLAPTDLRQTDALPSLEVVALWQSLPDEGHPLPGRADPSLQQTMRDAWRTQCGSLVAAILSTPWCVSLFKGMGSDDEAALHAQGRGIKDSSDGGVDEAPHLKAGSVESDRIAEVKRQFELGELRCSGLAGAFRRPAQSGARRHYTEAVQDVFDFVYLLGEVLVQFHRVSDGLGDYGMIRVAPWLHPFLETLVNKIQRIKAHLEKLNEAVEGVYVLARARGVKVEKPAPTSRMSARAHASIERAVTGRSSHVHTLLQTIEELRARSSPERLPHVMEGLGDACMALQTVLASQEFRAHVADGFPELPSLGNGPAVEVAGGSRLSIEGHKAPFPALTPGASASTTSSFTPPQLEDVTTLSETENELASVNSGAGGVGPEAPAAMPPVHAPRRELFADVHRMVTAGCGGGLKRHDERSLSVSDGRLFIFDKGSRTKVKTAVDIASGIEICRLAPEGIMSLVVQRLPQGASAQDGVSECKHYTFQFPSEQLAREFHDELTGFRNELARDEPLRL